MIDGEDVNIAFNELTGFYRNIIEAGSHIQSLKKIIGKIIMYFLIFNYCFMNDGLTDFILGKLYFSYGANLLEIMFV